MLCVGDKVKITKGTHKSKWGHILIIKDSFIQVKVVHYIKSKANGDSDDLIETKTVRAKKEFVEKIPDVVVEMPTAENLQPVFEFPEQKTDQEIVKEILDAMPDPPANDEDILSQHDENDPVVSDSTDTACKILPPAERSRWFLAEAVVAALKISMPTAFPPRVP